MVLDTPAQRLLFARKKHGKYRRPTDAAKAFGWTVPTYLGHENGDRNPSRAAAIRYGRAYGFRWEWILEGEGAPQSKVLNVRVPIAGEIRRGSAVHFYSDEKIKNTAELPPGGTASTLAIEVCEGSMRGIADDDWLFFFDHVRQPPTSELMGKLCIVELDAGQVLVKKLAPGRKKGRYDLESAVSEPTLRDQRVKWAARVTWIKPR
jgi:transcriptional regulator with XRE-family HTH domain